MIIREPMFQITPESGYSSLLGLHVKSPSDIVFVDSANNIAKQTKWKTGHVVTDSPILPINGEGWKELGNLRFKEGMWLPAAIAYSNGLIIDPTAFVLRLNRSEAYLRLERYAAALMDANDVLAIPDLPETYRKKAMARAARASYGKVDYAAAESVYMQWNEHDPDDDNALEGLNRVRLRLTETTGQYDWIRIFEESRESAHPDVADFVGPVEVGPSIGRGGGRGIFATRAIEIGELLVCYAVTYILFRTKPSSF